MKNKLIALTAVLGIAALASWAPQAEAVGYCSATYCAGKPLSATCGCPTWTDKPGQTAFCGSWNTVSRSGCWYEA